MEERRHTQSLRSPTDFEDRFLRAAFDNIRPDWDCGRDRISYTTGVDSITGGRPGEVTLFKKAYLWALRRYTTGSVPVKTPRRRRTDRRLKV